MVKRRGQWRRATALLHSFQRHSLQPDEACARELMSWAAQTLPFGLLKSGLVQCLGDLFWFGFRGLCRVEAKLLERQRPWHGLLAGSPFRCATPFFTFPSGSAPSSSLDLQLEFTSKWSPFRGPRCRHAQRCRCDTSLQRVSTLSARDRQLASWDFS